MYKNIKWKPDFSKWDGHDAEDLRIWIIKDTNDFLNSGDCSEELEPEVRETIRKIQTEADHEKLRGLIQDYFFNFFDAMQFFDADPQEAAEEDFPIYREVLGLERIDPDAEEGRAL